MPLRIVVHDYAGHPFQFQLSQELARRGHTVLHLYFAQVQTPQALAGKGTDQGYQIEGLRISAPFQKHSFIKRRQQEQEYGRVLCQRIRDFAPHCVISSNTPLDAQAQVQALCRQAKIHFTFWLQDVYSVAIARLLPRRLPIIGHLVAAHYTRLERRILRQSDAVVAITDRFLDILTEWRIDLGRCHVIENWAPTDEIRPMPRHNDWAAQHGLLDKQVLLYSGTLGMKHNPQIFVRLAQHFQTRPQIRIVVISEGLGADWLRQKQHDLGLDNLIILPYQPYDRLSQVLASGDVLIAILEPDAGVFSVPSKVLSYLSAGKAVLLSVPLNNLAAHIVQRSQSGMALAPGDDLAMIQAADHMLSSAYELAQMGQRARQYAQTAFDIRRIGDQFEAILCPDTVE